MRAVLDNKVLNSNTLNTNRPACSPQIRGCNQIGAIVRRLPSILDVGALPFWKLLGWSLHGWDPQFAPKSFDLLAGTCTMHGLVDFDVRTNKPFDQPKPRLTRMGAVALGFGNGPLEGRPVVGAIILDRFGNCAFGSGELLQPEDSVTTDAIFMKDGAVLCEVPHWWQFKRYLNKSGGEHVIDHEVTDKVRTIVDRGLRELA